MRPGQVSVLPAGLPLSWRWDGPVQSLHVSVDADAADALVADRLGAGAVKLPTPFLFDDALVRAQLEGLRVQAAAGGGDPLRAEMLVQRLVVHLAGARGAVGRPPAGMPAARLAAVIDWLEAHLAERVSIGDLARVAGVEASWFTRLFTVSLGASPYQYLLERRIVRAQERLRAGDAAADVAVAVGFVDQAHLTRHFRRVLGTTPAAWARTARREARNVQDPPRDRSASSPA